MSKFLTLLALPYLALSVPTTSSNLDSAAINLVSRQDPAAAAAAGGNTVTSKCGLAIPESCPWKALNTLAWVEGTPCPGPDEPYKQLDIFKRPPPPGKGKFAIKNYCEYELHVEPHAGNVIGEKFVIPAGGDKIADYLAVACPGCGVNYKVSKTADLLNPVQIEFATTAEGNVAAYDISLIDCLGPNRNDPSGCAGHEAGLQFSGHESCTCFQCEAGKWCDDQAYFYQENFCKTNNPVGGCPTDEGIIMEFCASKKA